MDLKPCFCVSAGFLLSALLFQYEERACIRKIFFLKLWVIILEISDRRNFFNLGASRESLLQSEPISPYVPFFKFPELSSVIILGP